MIYNFKTEGRSPKYFGGYQIPLELFENLRYSASNLKEVLTNQVNFKSDLSVITNQEVIDKKIKNMQ